MDEAGRCKVEGFVSFARNNDFVGVLAPACVVSLGRPVELGLQVDRARSGGAWATGLALKAKTPVAPFDDEAKFGIALSGGVAFDLTTRETAELFVNLPVSVRLSEIFQINLNIGGLWDRVEDRSFLTWGAGFELQVGEKHTVLAEVFGQGSDDPGAQLGLRWTPHERIDFDVIYGRNLAGERSDWITVGVNLRF